MNEKLEQLMDSLTKHAEMLGWHNRAIQNRDASDPTPIDDHREYLVMHHKQATEDRAAIRELFQAQIPANVGELITALRRKSHKQGDAHVMRILYPNDPTHKTIYEQAKQEADTAEDALRKALGVQR